MERTAYLHDEVSCSLSEKTCRVPDYMAVFDAVHHMLDTHTHFGDLPVGFLLFRCETSTRRFLMGHDDLDTRQIKALKPEILHEVTLLRQGIAARVRNGFVVDGTWMRQAQKEDVHELIDQDDVFHGVVFLLPAVVAPLLLGILGPLDRPLGSIVAKKGGSVLISSLSRRCSTWRLGAKPRFLRVFPKMGSSTWIHMFVLPSGIPKSFPCRDCTGLFFRYMSIKSSLSSGVASGQFL